MKVLECSSRGDKRFSAMYAKIGDETIEGVFQSRKLGANGRPVGKGRKPVYVLINGERHEDISLLSELYYALWHHYLTKRPRLIAVLEEYDGYTDMFDKSGRTWLKTEDHTQLKKGPINSQAEAIAAFMAGRPLHPLFEGR